MPVLKYPVPCHTCGEKIPAGTNAIKEKYGTRHPTCSGEPFCISCDDSVNCAACEFYKICNRKEIKRCMCSSCVENPLAHKLYEKTVEKTYPALKKSPKTIIKTEIETVDLFKTDYSKISKEYNEKHVQDIESKTDKPIANEPNSFKTKKKKEKHVQSSLSDLF